MLKTDPLSLYDVCYVLIAGWHLNLNWTGYGFIGWFMFFQVCLNMLPDSFSYSNFTRFKAVRWAETLCTQNASLQTMKEIQLSSLVRCNQRPGLVDIPATCFAYFCYCFPTKWDATSHNAKHNWLQPFSANFQSAPGVPKTWTQQCPGRLFRSPLKGNYACPSESNPGGRTSLT